MKKCLPPGTYVYLPRYTNTYGFSRGKNKFSTYLGLGIRYVPTCLPVPT